MSSRAKEPLYLNGDALPQTAPEFGQDWYATYLWTDFGLKFIDEALKEKKPFFLYLAHNAPHFPLMAPKEPQNVVGIVARRRLVHGRGGQNISSGRFGVAARISGRLRQTSVEDV